MSTDRDVTRTVRSWLEEGVTTLPDRVLDDVLHQIPATPQRRGPWWPAWRLPPMNNTAKLALAAAAVLVVAFLGIRYLLPANVGGPGETPVPTEAPSPVALPDQGPLEPGTYVVDHPDLTPRSFTLTVPAGWTTDGGFVVKGDAGADVPDVAVVSWIITHVFAEACLWTTAQEDSLVEARTPEEIVDALAGQGGHETIGPDAVALGGYSAQRLEFIVPDDFDIASCSGGFLRLWPDPGPNLGGGLAVERAGQTVVIHVVDIDGDAVAIASSFTSDASATDVAELEEVLASIRFAESAP